MPEELKPCEHDWGIYRAYHCYHNPEESFQENVCFKCQEKTMIKPIIPNPAERLVLDEEELHKVWFEKNQTMDASVGAFIKNIVARFGAQEKLILDETKLMDMWKEDNEQYSFAVNKFIHKVYQRFGSVPVVPISRADLLDCLSKASDDFKADEVMQHNMSFLSFLSERIIQHFASGPLKVDGNTSDGYHTFNELYDHRCLLWINLCLVNKDKCYLVPEHFEGWFLLGMKTDYGQMSYHCPNKFFDLVKSIKIEHPEYDGHTSNDVIERLTKAAFERAKEGKG